MADETTSVEHNGDQSEVADTELTELAEDAGAADGGDAGRARREAKSLRDRLRATESERDGIAGRLEAMQAAEIGRLAGDRLARGADLIEIGGHAVADLLDENGAVDPTRVTAAVDGLLSERTYLKRQRFQGSADGGAGLGPTAEAGPSWAGLFGRNG